MRAPDGFDGADDFRVVTAGDSALLIELANRIDPAINERAISIAGAIRAADLTGVRDVTSTFRSVAVYFDPLHTNVSRLVKRAAEAAATARVSAPTADAPIRVPVCYGGALGPDLGSVAAFAGITEAAVVGLHTSRSYRVFMLGFLPGFTYMGTVDARIAAPRLAEPRSKVEAGSVGIAGSQTGIYPVTTPGGWRIVGRTAVKPFDSQRAEPFLFKAGDTVQFYPIDAAEYHRSAPVR